MSALYDQLQRKVAQLVREEKRASCAQVWSLSLLTAMRAVVWCWPVVDINRLRAVKWTGHQFDERRVVPGLCNPRAVGMQVSVDNLQIKLQEEVNAHATTRELMKRLKQQHNMNRRLTQEVEQTVTQLRLGNAAATSSSLGSPGTAASPRQTSFRLQASSKQGQDVQAELDSRSKHSQVLRSYLEFVMGPEKHCSLSMFPCGQHCI
jgi:hypothetical protein